MSRQRITNSSCEYHELETHLLGNLYGWVIWTSNNPRWVVSVSWTLAVNITNSRRTYQATCMERQILRACLTFAPVYEWVMSHTYEWVMSHTHEWVMSHAWISHIPHIRGRIWHLRLCMNESCPTNMDESCHTYEWVISHISVGAFDICACVWMSHVPHTWMSHVTHMNKSYHTYPWVYLIFAPVYEWVVSHTHGWVMSHTWMSHITHIRGRIWHWRLFVRESSRPHVNESCPTHKNESCRTHKWVMSRISVGVWGGYN